VSTARSESPLTDLVGQYPVLNFQGDPQAIGLVEIVADDEQVGVKLIPLEKASHPVVAGEFLSPAESTTVEVDGDLIKQHFEEGENNKLDIKFLIQDGYLDIQAEQCTELGCTFAVVRVSSGKSSGELVTIDKFFKQIAGDYKIELAGGIKPKEDISAAAVIAEGAQAIFVMPYCPPGSPFCDPGYTFINYPATKIFKRLGPDNIDVYDLLVSTEAGQLYYRWENKAGELKFQNIQYQVGSDYICLEHVLTKK